MIQSCNRPQTQSNDVKSFLPSDSQIRYTGRFHKTDSSSYSFSYPGTSIEFSFEGTFCELKLSSINPGKDNTGKEYQNYFYLIVDNKDPEKIAVGTQTSTVRIPDLSPGEHTVQLFKLTESFVGKCIFRGVTVSGNALLPLKKNLSRRIEFIGNSITCGYGNEGENATCPFSAETENNYLAYGAIASRRLDAYYTATAYSGKGMYRNYDGSTKESLSLIYDRTFPDEVTPKWDFKTEPKPDVVVINLGTNDFATGVPDSLVFTNTYVNFLKRIRGLYPEAYIVCMEGPMISDDYPKGTNAWTHMQQYITASSKILINKGDQRICTFFATVQKAEDLGCDYHPNVKKHESMGAELSSLIKSKMGW